MSIYNIQIVWWKLYFYLIFFYRHTFYSIKTFCLCLCIALKKKIEFNILHWINSFFMLWSGIVVFYHQMWDFILIYKKKFHFAIVDQSQKKNQFNEYLQDHLKNKFSSEFNETHINDYFQFDYKLKLKEQKNAIYRNLKFKNEKVLKLFEKVEKFLVNVFVYLMIE